MLRHSTTALVVTAAGLVVSLAGYISLAHVEWPNDRRDVLSKLSTMMATRQQKVDVSKRIFSELYSHCARLMWSFRPLILVGFTGCAVYDQHPNRDLVVLSGIWLLLTYQTFPTGGSSNAMENDDRLRPSSVVKDSSNGQDANQPADLLTTPGVNEPQGVGYCIPCMNPDDSLSQSVNLKATTNVFRPPRPTTSTTPNASTTTPKTPHTERYLEIMVHNVSHTDLVLGLDADNSSKRYIRPRFSTFHALSKTVLRHLGDTDLVVNVPKHVRSMSDERYSILRENESMTPVGLKLGRLASIPPSRQDIRIRESDEDEILNDIQALSAFQISHVFFPLLATLLPVWKRVMDAREYKRDVKRVLILVTGVGTPRNRQHSVSGNSTACCANLMEAFLARADPKLVVVKIHSETNVFRYDENIRFVENELMPILHSYRDSHATGNPYPDEPTYKRVSPVVFENGDDWRSSFHVILSSADGSPARTHAIQASLRPYRPTYFHFWQLKTFWHESKIVEDDVEVHSFETMETLPPKDVDRIDDVQIQMVLKSMREFYQEIRSSLTTKDNDIYRFWLRKTHKPVLAILLVHMVGDNQPHLFRGTNMEVSMPTGSLCAERNAIGSALAMFPDLKRSELKMIAVLAVPPEDEISHGLPKSFSSASFVEEIDIEQRMIRSRKPSISSEGDVVENDLGTSSMDVQQGAPLRRINLHSKGKHRQQRTVVIQSSKDINPLPPCGACNEWLKKIAETNPYFKIITFVSCENQLK